MKISELIDLLNEMKNEHGDVEVKVAEVTEKQCDRSLWNWIWPEGWRQGNRNSSGLCGKNRALLLR